MKTILALWLVAALPGAVRAQCPDGTPPPCRGAHVAAAAPTFSVAVLSFENRSRDTADISLGDGLADEAGLLRTAEEWAVLRGNPRFERLIANP